MKKPISIRLDTTLHRELLARAGLQEKTATVCITEAIDEWLNKFDNRKKLRKIMQVAEESE